MHTLTRRTLLWSAPLARLAAAALPAGVSALPSERQLRWHQMETYAFLHFTINTFTGKEWGYGDEDPSLFHPTAFDPAAIISALKAGGMKGVILTCKHHDGFCLWPTKTTERCIRNTGWRGGKADVVREISDEARRQGLKFGVYLSPWDRSTAKYGTPEYVPMYREQLRELLTGYGPIFEVWHDGANGGDGYYGGAREKRTIDKRTYYDWPKTWELVRQLQPEAVIFSDIGPDLRWVGNENGYAADTCWETYDPVAPDGGPAAPGLVRESQSPIGTLHGTHWMPPECDVSIRPGWFWHEAENTKVKTPAELFELYCRSVGRGGSLLLNIPPDRRGLLYEADVAALKSFGDTVRTAFETDLAEGAKRRNTGNDLELDLGRHHTFNLIRIREDIRQGQRIEKFSVDQWNAEGWKPIAEATSVGACRLIRLAEPVTAARVRLHVTATSAPPVIREFGLFHSRA